MVTPPRLFLEGSIHHVYNRGVDKRAIFSSHTDYHRFLLTLAFYQQEHRLQRLSLTDFKLSDRAEPLRFSIIAYCLMKNHFHLILMQLMEGGISRGLSELANSYTRYFNLRHDRTGRLFQGPFQSVSITSDEQLVHDVRYAFLNPVVAGLCQHPRDYQWSSYHELFQDNQTRTFTDPSMFKEFFKDQVSLETFITDHIDYARSLERVKHFK